MSKEHPILSILNMWPSRQALADDIGKPVVVVHRWHQRQSIPAKYDTRLLEAASRRNIPLLWRDLMEARAATPDQQGHTSLEKQGAKHASA